jgi:hypothetical protein
VLKAREDVEKTATKKPTAVDKYKEYKEKTAASPASAHAQIKKLQGASKKAPTAADYLKLQNDAREREESQGKTAMQKAKKRMTGK